MSHCTRPPGHYVTDAELGQMIRVARRTRRVSAPLAEALTAIARGLFARRNWAAWYDGTADDFAHDAYVFLSNRPLKRVNPSLKPFNFFTKCVERFALRKMAVRGRELDLLAELRTADGYAKLRNYEPTEPPAEEPAEEPAE